MDGNCCAVTTFGGLDLPQDGDQRQTELIRLLLSLAMM
jgi:hypothetical protein